MKKILTILIFVAVFLGGAHARNACDFVEPNLSTYYTLTDSDVNTVYAARGGRSIAGLTTQGKQNITNNSGKVIIPNAIGEAEKYKKVLRISTNAFVPENLDTDVDGIPDGKDLDDDNDGILDKDERKCYTETTEEAFPSSASGVLYADIILQDNNNAVNLQNLENIIVDFGKIIPAGTKIKIKAQSSNYLRCYGSMVNNAFSAFVDKQHTSSNLIQEYSFTFDIRYLKLTSFSNYTWIYWVKHAAFSKEICVDNDTDDDGTPDRLDNDSDNDGCPDAIEGSAGLIASDLDKNNRILGNVGVDIETMGVPMKVIRAYGEGHIGSSMYYKIGQTKGASADAAYHKACDDIDGDGIVDDKDFDNDNDGILDSEECPNLVDVTDNVSFEYAPEDFNGSSEYSAYMGVDGKPYRVHLELAFTHLVENQSSIKGNFQFNASSDWTNGQYILNSYPESNELWPSILPSSDGGAFLSFSRSGEEIQYHIEKAETGKIYEFEFEIGTLPAYGLDVPSGVAAVVPENVYVPDQKLSVTGAEVILEPNIETYTMADYPSTVSKTSKPLDPKWKKYRYIVKATGTHVIFSLTSISGKCVITLDNFRVNKRGGESDTDGDGIPNHLDLDSDNDGCPDAKEGSADLESTNTAGGTLTDGNGGVVTTNLTTTSVDANGVPTMATASGQGIGQSLDATKNDCLDTDGDGIPDVDDLDDDNDGILDVDENDCVLELITNSALEGNVVQYASTGSVPTYWQAIESSNSVFSSPDFPQVLPSDFITTPDVVNLYPIISGTRYKVKPHSGSTCLAGYHHQSQRLLEGIKQNVSGFVLGQMYTITFYQAVKVDQEGLSDETHRTGQWIVFGDDNLLGYSNVSTTTVEAENPNVEWEFRTIRFRANATSMELKFIPWDPAMIKKVRMVIDDISINAGGCDTDHDGIFNHLDLDSDNDGCPDAKEGSADLESTNTAGGILTDGNGGIVTTNLTTTDVDTKGVPIKATATGQGMGQSQESVKNDCLDTDGDKVPDWKDLDNDNDGILDAEEIAGCNSPNLLISGGLEGDDPGIGNHAHSKLPNNWGAIPGTKHYIDVTYPSLATPDLTDGNSPLSNSAATPAEGERCVAGLHARLPSGLCFQEGIEQTVLGLTVGKTYQLKLKQAVDIQNININDNEGQWRIYFDDVLKMTTDAVSTTIGSTDYFNNNAQWSDWSVLFKATSTTIRIGFVPYDGDGNPNVRMLIDDISLVEVCDTDDDGIPNHLDLDSDNDGCPDAKEGSADLESTNTAGGILTDGNGGVVTTNLTTTDIDANGVPTIATASRQGIGQALDATKNDCDDSDDDGVPDWKDLDDDNDGILDTDECAAVAFSFAKIGNNLEATQKGMHVTMTSVGTPHAGGLSIYLSNELPPDLQHPSADALGNAGLTEVGLSFLNSGAYFIASCDGFMTTSATRTFTFDAPTTEPLLLSFTGLEAKKNATKITFTAGEIIKVVNGTGVGTQTYISNDLFTNTKPPYLVDAAGLTLLIPTGTRSVSYTLTPPGAPLLGDAYYVALSTACADTDGDGIPNRLDLDSDGDGCADAVEGAENVSADMLSINMRINITNQGGVDAQGVPNVVNSGGAADVGADQGQGIGSSQNAAINVCYIDAKDDVTQTPQGKTLIGNVLTNDDGNNLTVTDVKVDTDGDGVGDLKVPLNTPTIIAGGTITIKDDGTYTFEPADGYTGRVPGIIYTAVGDKGNADTAQLKINVIPDIVSSNNPPVADDDKVKVEAGSAATVDVLSNDSDIDGDALTVVAAILKDGYTVGSGATKLSIGTSQAVYKNGSKVGSIAVKANGTLTFVPEANFTDTVPVEYTVSDDRGGTDKATVDIEIVPVGSTKGVNANDDATTGYAGSKISITPLGNDQITGGSGTLNLKSVIWSDGTVAVQGALKTIAGTGTFVWNRDGTVDFTPEAGFVGTVDVPYVAADGTAVNANTDMAVMHFTSLKKASCGFLRSNRNVTRHL